MKIYKIIIGFEGEHEWVNKNPSIEWGTAKKTAYEKMIRELSTVEGYSGKIERWDSENVNTFVAVGI